MATKEPGYVYILTNPSFREDWVKIGMTQNMDERLRTLDTTALPLPFKKYATLQTAKYEKAEKHVHHYIETFTNLRIRDKREFFNVKPEQALKIFCEVAELLDDAIVTRYDDDGNPIPVYSPCPPKPENTAPVKQMDKPKAVQKRGPKVWMVPASPKYFDHRACFDELGLIYWKQFNNLQVGDTGYIYMSAPVKTVLFKFEVAACNLSLPADYDKEKKFYKREEDFENAKKHNRFYLMKRIGEHKTGVLTLANMKQNGLKGAPMGTLNLSDQSFKELLGYIEDNF